ncbi:MAG: gephyrin-like molybdotransferase receptor GlpR [Rhodococcus sp. (in: high G+C Gram-positive bacteria)]
MPNSVIWIGLVAIWLFVLVPMVVNSRPRIRRTTDVALATRVLHRGGARMRVDPGPAAGHRSDPDWRPSDVRNSDVRRADVGQADVGQADVRHLDSEDPMETHDEQDQRVEHEDDYFSEDFVPQRRGRGGFDPEADAIARAARYSFRQRAVLGSVFVIAMSAALGFLATPIFWWVFAVTLVGLSSYLFYLRRQVRIEEDIRRRRMHRLQRSRLGVESNSDPELKLTPERLRRPGAVVLEVDDEDPAFDHLEHYDDEVGDSYLDVRMRRAAGE